MQDIRLKPQNMRVHNKQVLITTETLTLTCKWYADNAQGCIDEAVSGEVFVNDLEKYTADKLADKTKYLSGKFDPWLGFWQKAHYLQSGQSVGLLG